MQNQKKPNPVDIHVGSRIRMRRVMLGMSQEKLGEGLGITFQQIQKYEKGTNRVGASRLQAISGILSVPPSFFFDGMDQPETSTAGGADAELGGISGFIATKEGLDLNRAFVKIADQNIRRKVVALVKSLGAVPDDEVAGSDVADAASETV